MIKTVIPVKNLSALAKADESVKVLVLRCTSSGRRSFASVLAENVTQGITGQLKNAEVKNLDAGRMVIASGAQNAWPSPYNDPESDLFVPQDEMPSIYDALIQCDITLVAVDTHWNFPSRSFVGVAERLQAFKVGMDSGQVKLKNKVVGVIATSAYGGANLAASSIAQMFSHLGFLLPGHSIITAQESAAKEDHSAAIQAAGVALVDAALSFRRT
jgi:multimeric flavodoxin WrbA